MTSKFEVQNEDFTFTFNFCPQESRAQKIREGVLLALVLVTETVTCKQEEGKRRGLAERERGGQATRTKVQGGGRLLATSSLLYSNPYRMSTIRRVKNALQPAGVRLDVSDDVDRVDELADEEEERTQPKSVLL